MPPKVSKAQVIDDQKTKLKPNKENDNENSKTEAPKLKRPTSAYIMYISAKRAEAKAENPTMPPKEFMKHMAQL